MKFLKTVLKNALLAGCVAGMSVSASAVTISKDHIDIGIAYEDGEWDLHVHDEETDTEYEAGDALFLVGPAAQTTVPNLPAFTNFLGTAGSAVWILPQAEDVDLPFIGLATEEVEDGTFVDDTVSLRLVSVKGPSKGYFALYGVDGFGNPQVRMNSRDGISGADQFDLIAGSHAHFNWAFSKPGSYTLNFEASGTLDDGSNTVTVSGPVAYKFKVVSKALLTHDHVDVGIAFEEGEWDLHIHDEESDTEYGPREATLQVGAAAQTVAPSQPAFASILGTAGSPVWILPVAEDPDLLFLGLGTEEVEPGTFVNDQITLSLVSVTGPGHFALYSVDGFGIPTARMNTRGGSSNQYVANAGSHAHLNWAFSAPGTYIVRLEASGTLDDGSSTFTSSGPVEYTFHVIADSAKPTVAIASPANNLRTSSPAVTIQGTARDNAKVKQVLLDFNGSGFQPLTLDSKIPHW